MTDSLAALDSSVRRLADLVRPLDDDALVRPAYPSEWRIAEVLSHIGSGAVIFARILTDGLAGTTPPEDFNPSVWDRWNAMAPRAQADECLVVDRDFVTRLEAVGDEDRARLQLSLGPMELDWETFVQMRLSEHLLHEWDVAVALDPAATLADDGTAIVVDRVGTVAGWASKAVGEPVTVTVSTTAPERTFTIAVGDDVTLTEADATEAAAADAALTMPAEALVRLVYGRLDADHTPAAVTGDPAVLDRLRPVFPGF